MFDYVSDLHIDNGAMSGPQGWFGRFEFTKHVTGKNEILVVAGDTGEYVDDTIDFMKAARAHYKYVVGVRGNHEKDSKKPIYGDWTRIEEGVVLLDNELTLSVVIDDIAFVGSELANGFDYFMKDVIDQFTEFLKPEHPCKQIVIISHYCPTEDLKEIHGIDSTDKCNGLLKHLPPNPEKPVIIVFGHTHLEADMMINGYRLVSNPRGYRGKRRDGTGYVGFKAS